MRGSSALWKCSTLCALLAVSPLTAGVVFQVETTYHTGSESGRTESSEMSVEKPNLKMEIQSGGSGSDQKEKDAAIYRGDRRQMVVVDHATESYMVIDENFVNQVGDQIAEAKKRFEEQIQHLDPKQRAMMEEMLEQRGGAGGMLAPGAQMPKTEFVETGERGTKQGYPCVRYDVLRGGEKVRELWVTDWSNIRGGQDIVNAFKDMAGFYGDLLDSFEQMAGASGFFDSDNNPMESFTRVDGFPVVTRSFEGGELESETVLERVTERNLDPDAFEPPKGYRLRTMGPE